MVMPYGPLNPDPNSPGQLAQRLAQGQPVPVNPYAGLGSLASSALQAPRAAPANPYAHLGAPAAPAAPVAPPAPKGSKLQRFAASPYMSQALIGAAQGFFDGDLGAAFGGFGKGIAGFDASQMKGSELGGPDNAFEIVTDPTTGQRTYRPVEEIQSYLKDKEAAAFRKSNTPKAPDVKDVSDMIGRAASAVQKGLPAAEARQYLLNAGIPEAAIPANLSANYSAFGATVPQAQAQELRQATQDFRVTDRNRVFDNTVHQQGFTNGLRTQANSRANAAAGRAASKARSGGKSGGTGKIQATRALNGKTYVKRGGQWFEG